jgi:RNA polymerase sigma factor (sigma-70 family)
MMTDVLTKQNSLMERILREHGALIRGAVHKALGGSPATDDVMSEVHFAVFLTMKKVGADWNPPRSFLYAVIRNKVNDFLRQKYRDRNGMEEMKKRQAEQAEQREGAMARVHTLSHSEFKVFRLLGLGLTNQEIAENLHISTLTVRSHMKKVHAKCAIKERTRLALTAYQACHLELAAGENEERRAPEVTRDGLVLPGGFPAVPVSVRKNGGRGSDYARYGSLS